MDREKAGGRKKGIGRDGERDRDGYRIIDSERKRARYGWLEKEMDGERERCVERGKMDGCRGGKRDA